LSKNIDMVAILKKMNARFLYLYIWFPFFPKHVQCAGTNECHGSTFQSFPMESLEQLSVFRGEEDPHYDYPGTCAIIISRNFLRNFQSLLFGGFILYCFLCFIWFGFHMVVTVMAVPLGAILCALLLLISTILVTWFSQLCYTRDWQEYG
jgi:hypothetical protein